MGCSKARERECLGIFAHACDRGGPMRKRCSWNSTTLASARRLVSSSVQSAEICTRANQPRTRCLKAPSCCQLRRNPLQKYRSFLQGPSCQAAAETATRHMHNPAARAFWLKFACLLARLLGSSQIESLIHDLRIVKCLALALHFAVSSSTSPSMCVLLESMIASASMSVFSSR